MKKRLSPNYSVVCPHCNAPIGESCRTVTGQERWKVHQRRAEAVHGVLPPDRCYGASQVDCPSCGAAPGERCRRYSRAADQFEPGARRSSDGNYFVYCPPYGTKRQFCRSRWDAANNRHDFLDAQESAAESGLWVPPEFHETATETGLLAEVGDGENSIPAEQATEQAAIKPRPVGQRWFYRG